MAEFYQDTKRIGVDSFELYIGIPHLLLIDDETSIYRSMVQTSKYYRTSLEPLDIRVCYLDLNRWKMPGADAVNETDAIIWFTGLSGGNVLTEEEQNLLAGFLDGGGGLFLTGQNIAGDTLAAGFLEQYLHIADAGVWSGSQLVTGEETNPVGTGLSFSITGGTGSGTQVSPHKLQPGNNGLTVFFYGSDTADIAAIFCESNLQNGSFYKTLFMGFGFEGIAEEADRDTLMQRIIRWFGPMTGIRNRDWGRNDTPGDLQLYPNPVSHFVTLYVEQEVYPTEITIFDLSGKILQQDSWPGISKTTKLDLENLPPGHYLVQAQGDKVRLRAKMMKYR